MGSRKQFAPEFKREAIQLLESGRRPASEIARELGIARNQLYKWQTELRARGAGAFPWWMAWQHHRPAPGLVHHSDQGNQYRASLYQTLLARRGVVPSMSRKGNRYDNAPVESFFSSLKNELVRHRQFQNQAEAQVAVTDYIDRFYNRQRLHQALGYRSPEEFERQESGT